MPSLFPLLTVFFTGDAPDSVRDQMMRQDHRFMTFQSARREGEPAVSAIRTPPDPEIVELEEQRAQLKRGKYRVEGHENEREIRRLINKIRTKRAYREKQVVKEYPEDYFYHRPTWDIEQQARGEEEEEYIFTVCTAKDFPGMQASTELVQHHSHQEGQQPVKERQESRSLGRRRVDRLAQEFSFVGENHRCILRSVLSHRHSANMDAHDLLSQA
ncbi:hypothetical protein FBEOM_12766 [Fusarium beomiforme]|uniref:Uncharacterized protein n=1 Tax=Fusarium beomiforme TaxID=44412 RepID=A0A9P5A6Z3_9HYPO|nr:hypothetical protein FBEOM_12766 [Fusarium beomiforme]